MLPYSAKRFERSWKNLLAKRILAVHSHVERLGSNYWAVYLKREYNTLLFPTTRSENTTLSKIGHLESWKHFLDCGQINDPTFGPYSIENGFVISSLESN